MAALDDAVEVLLAVVRATNERDLRYPAAALAYYAFVSFLPLLVLVVAVLGERIARRVTLAVPRVLTPEARELVTESIATASGRLGATLLAVAVLAWSASNIAVDFLTVVERVEGRSGDSRRSQLRDAVGILGAFAVVAVAFVLVGVAVAVLPLTGPVAAVGWPLVAHAVLTLAFLPLYYVPSRVVTSLPEALPGAFTAAVGWTVLLAGIRFYAENAGQYAIYGVLSGIIILLTGLYAAALVLIVGVVVNVTLLEE